MASCACGTHPILGRATLRHGNVARGHLEKQAGVANELIKKHSLTSENGLVLYNSSLKPSNAPFAAGNPRIKPDIQVFKKTANGWERVGNPIEIEPKGRGFQHKSDLYRDNNGGAFDAIEY